MPSKLSDNGSSGSEDHSSSPFDHYEELSSLDATEMKDIGTNVSAII